MEAELKEIVEDGGRHVVQMDETLGGLSHFGPGQGSEVLAALWKSSEVHLKNEATFCFTCTHSKNIYTCLTVTFNYL